MNLQRCNKPAECDCIEVPGCVRVLVAEWYPLNLDRRPPVHRVYTEQKAGKPYYKKRVHCQPSETVPRKERRESYCGLAAFTQHRPNRVLAQS